MFEQIKIHKDFGIDHRLVVYEGDCLNLLKKIPSGTIQLAVTSPPYNLGKEYEKNFCSPNTWNSKQP